MRWTFHIESGDWEEEAARRNGSLVGSRWSQQAHGKGACVYLLVRRALEPECLPACMLDPTMLDSNHHDLQQKLQIRTAQGTESTC